MVWQELPQSGSGDSQDGAHILVVTSLTHAIASVSEAIQSVARNPGWLRRSAPPHDGNTCHRILAALKASELCQSITLASKEGAGKAGRRPHPRSGCNKKHPVEPQVSRTSGPPCAMVCDVYVLSLVRRAFWPPCRDNALARVATPTPPLHPTPRAVTIAIRPHVEARRRDTIIISEKMKYKYFRRKDAPGSSG
jgi:hypothetical protein